MRQPRIRWFTWVLEEVKKRRKSWQGIEKERLRRRKGLETFHSLTHKVKFSLCLID
jgi:hypothetical protein